MKDIRYIFIILFLLTSCTKARDVNIDSTISNTSIQLQNKTENTNFSQKKNEPFIVNCTKEKYTNNCSTTSVSNDKMINQNDLLFLGQKLYLDNYNPLYFNVSPEFLNNSIYTKDSSGF